MTKLPKQIQRGFTLVELVVTLILIGILSAMAIPRFNLLSGFDEIGYRDQVIAALEFARKSAVAQRRNVQVTLSGSTLSFLIASDIPEGPAASTFDRPLLVPGSSSNSISPRGATTVSAGPATLEFNPLGAATATSYLYTITGESSHDLNVDSGTGYVY